MSSQLTQREKIEELAKKGLGRPSIVEELTKQGEDVTEWQVRKTLRELRENPNGLTEEEEARLQKNSRPSHHETVRTLQPVHVHVPRNRKKKAKESDLETIVFVGDTHAPFVDERAFSVACQIIEDVKPHRLVHLGDVGDFYTISDFTKDPNRRLQLQDDIEATAELLGVLAQTVSDDTPKYLIQGNHEARLRRYIKKNAPALASLDQLKMENLLGLKGLGWEYIDHDKEILDDFLIKHGDRVSKHSGYTAKREMEEAWMSGISGHSHRQALHKFTSRRTYIRDEPPCIWIENGCLCQTNMEYIDGSANWQQGFTVMHFADDGHIVPEMIHICEGRAYYNGRLYTG